MIKKRLSIYPIIRRCCYAASADRRKLLTILLLQSAATSCMDKDRRAHGMLFTRIHGALACAGHPIINLNFNSMSVKYHLQPNPITTDPDDHSARVNPVASLDFDSIVQEMLRRGTTVTDTDAQAVVTLFMEVISDKASEGNNVNLPLVSIRPGIRGVFNGASDSFDPARHTIRATVSAGPLLEEKMSQGRPEKILHNRPKPELVAFVDYNSQTTDALLTPGGIGEITGEELKYNHDDAEEGIFFIEDAGTETRVDVLSVRTDGKLMFQIPSALTPGNYALVVRRKYGNAQEIRTGELNKSLTINT
ncbi:MAG: DUF4469 domain-containing protein [Bacteroidales bacterium]|nr:DUF4469 domain-containing protein [Bacteroidales bacterium]